MLAPLVKFSQKLANSPAEQKIADNAAEIAIIEPSLLAKI